MKTSIICTVKEITLKKLKLKCHLIKSDKSKLCQGDRVATCTEKVFEFS